MSNATYKCDHCHREFKSSRSLACHLNVIHGIRPIFRCVCSFETLIKRDFERHQRSCKVFFHNQAQQSQAQQAPVQNIINNTYITNIHTTNTNTTTNTQNNVQINISPEQYLLPMTDENITQNIKELYNYLIKNNLDIIDSDTFARYWHDSAFKHTILTSDASRQITVWTMNNKQLQTDKNAFKYIEKVSNVIKNSSELQLPINTYVHSKNEEGVHFIGTDDLDKKMASVKFAQFWKHADTQVQTAKSIAQMSQHVKNNTYACLQDNCKLKWLAYEIRKVAHISSADFLIVSNTTIGMRLRRLIVHKDPNVSYENNTINILCDDDNRASYSLATIVQLFKTILMQEFDMFAIQALMLLDDDERIHAIIQSEHVLTSRLMANRHWQQLHNWIKNISTINEMNEYENQIMIGLLLN